MARTATFPAKISASSRIFSADEHSAGRSLSSAAIVRRPDYHRKQTTSKYLNRNRRPSAKHSRRWRSRAYSAALLLPTINRTSRINGWRWAANRTLIRGLKGSSTIPTMVPSYSSYLTVFPTAQYRYLAVFPTHVGVNRLPCASWATTPSIPHTRGGEPVRTTSITPFDRYSPHTWG